MLDDYRSAKGKIKKSVRAPEEIVQDAVRKELKPIPAPQEPGLHAPCLLKELSLPTHVPPVPHDISKSNVTCLLLTF